MIDELNARPLVFSPPRRRAWLLLVISIAITVPCFWHWQLEAGDLGSHVYNAWLAQLIAKGQAPGLYMVRQWDNVLVDWMLLHTANAFGFTAAGKIVGAACVLLFFWGTFAFVAAVNGQPPWFLAPCIAMLAYGYSFNMGFFNYYASIGLAALSLALLWRGRGVPRAIGIVLIPVAMLAHPLGLAWLLATGVYLLLWLRLDDRWKWCLPATAVFLLCLVHWYLEHRVTFPVDWAHDPFYVMNGADQLTLYSSRYAALSWVALLFGVVCVVAEIVSRQHAATFWHAVRLPGSLYVVAIASVALLPENLRPSQTGAWIGLLASRLTILVAIVGLCVIACVRPRKWHLAGFAACAIVFFSFLYQDTRVLNRMESSADQLLADVPFGTRVLSTIWAPPGSRISFINHFVDRACIGHCFSYANYEPSSGQFRIRVLPDSPVVSAVEDDTEDMQAGGYDVQDEDLPMKEIYQCDAQDLTKLCIRDLQAGETNGRLGYKPPN